MMMILFERAETRGLNLEWHCPCAKSRSGEKSNDDGTGQLHLADGHAFGFRVGKLDRTWPEYRDRNSRGRNDGTIRGVVSGLKLRIPVGLMARGCQSLARLGIPGAMQARNLQIGRLDEHFISGRAYSVPQNVSDCAITLARQQAVIDVDGAKRGHGVYRGAPGDAPDT